MGRLEIDWDDLFDNSSTDHEEGIYLGSPSPAAAKRARVGPAATKRARAGAEGVARASLGDEQPRGTQALHLRLEALCSELERRVVTRASAKTAADRGQDTRSAAENVHNFNQEDEQGEHVACKCCLKSSPVLVRRKKNHEQADGHRKRVPRAAAKNDDKEPAAPPEEIFEAVREIPSLERAGLLRAYSMLIRDDRLFRSLMVLPKDMRKDWLLMEIENQ
ncbi:unnamed protein product [Miscanthus lutarioriparius]|uniref:Uncharacterized protein n=1 Tax=Miscanthus lutarioriparius TaxID=422564 RepID=A0A811RB25_9POAL|nr:unnamed protein product [Miscanthus lutarioriparius]